MLGELIAVAAEKGDLAIINLVDKLDGETWTKKSKKILNSCEAGPWVYWVDDGKKLLYTDSQVTILFNCDVDTDGKDITSDPVEWTEIFRVEDKIFPIQTQNDNLSGIIHGTQVKDFNSDLI